MAAPFELGLLAAPFGFAGGRFALAITFFDFPVGLRAGLDFPRFFVATAI
jgi:hypothetical protein